MTFPTSPLPPNGNVYFYEEPTTGRTWSYDSGVWYPRENSKTNDLKNVVSVKPPTSYSSSVVGSFDPSGIGATHEIGTSGQFARFELQSGYDFVLDGVSIQGLYRGTSSTAVLLTLDIYQGISDPAFSPNVTLSSAEVSTVQSNLGSPIYSSSVAGSVLGTSATTVNFPFTESTIIQRGRFTAILTLTSATGTVFYSGDLETGYTVTGTPAQELPEGGSLITYGGTNWELNAIDTTGQDLNYKVSDTRDPIDGSDTSWRLGTFWVNTATDTVFVYSYGPYFDPVLNDSAVQSYDLGWKKFPKGLEIKDKGAVANYVQNALPATTYSFLAAGDLCVRTSDNTLFVYNGSTWKQI